MKLLKICQQIKERSFQIKDEIIKQRKRKYEFNEDFTKCVMHKQLETKRVKVETLEEFLAKGGKITKCPKPTYCPHIDNENPNIIIFGKGFERNPNGSKKRKKRRKKAKS